MSARSSIVLAAAASLLMFACAAAQPEPSTSMASTTASSGTAGTASPPIAELWRARCGQCHVRVEPKTRERAALRPALERHRKRARLNDSDIDELVDYLAK